MVDADGIDDETDTRVSPRIAPVDSLPSSFADLPRLQNTSDTSPRLRDETAAHSHSASRPCRRPAITWGPDNTREAEDRRSLARAYAYAQKFSRLHERLALEGDSAMSLRSELSHQQEVCRSKRDFVFDSLSVAMLEIKNIIAQLSSNALHPSIAQSMEGLREIREQAAEDQTALQDQERAVRRLEQSCKHIDRSVGRLQDSLLAAAQRVADNAQYAGVAADGISLTTVSSEPKEADTRPPDIPPLVEDYLDKLGDRRIMLERVYDLEFDIQEEITRRELLADQDQPLDPAESSRLDQEYQSEYTAALADFRTAEIEVARALERCKEQDLEPEDFRAAPSSVDDGSPAPPTAIEAAAGTLSPANSLPPHRVPTTLLSSFGRPSSALLTVAGRLTDTDASISSPQPVSPAPTDRVQNWIVGLEDADPIPDELITDDQSDAGRPSRPMLEQMHQQRPQSWSGTHHKDQYRSLDDTGKRTPPMFNAHEIFSNSRTGSDQARSKDQTPKIPDQTSLQRPQLVIPEISIEAALDPSPLTSKEHDDASARAPTPSTHTDVSSQPKPESHFAPRSPDDARTFWPQDTLQLSESRLRPAVGHTGARKRVSSIGSRPRTPATSEPLSAHDSVTGLYSKIRFGHLPPQAPGHSLLRRADRWLLENGDRVGASHEYKELVDPETQYQVGTVFETFVVSPTKLSDKALSNFTSSAKFPDTSTRIGRFVVTKSPVDQLTDFGGQTGFEALAIKTYGGRGVGKSGVAKAYHAIIYTGGVPPKLNPDENPQPLPDGSLEAGVCAWPIHVVPNDPSVKLDGMSRLDFSDSMHFTFRVTAKIIGKVDQPSIRYFKVQQLAVDYAIRLAEDAMVQDPEALTRKTRGEMEGQTTESQPVHGKQPSLALTHNQLRQFAKNDSQALSLANLQAFPDFQRLRPTS